MNDLAAAFRAAADPSVRILGPAPAPIIKIRNLYRFHLQLRCPNSRPLQNVGEHGAQAASRPSWHRAGDRRRPNHHAVSDCWQHGPQQKKSEFGQKSLKFRLQDSTIGLFSQPFVHTRDSRQRNSWLNSGQVGHGG